MVLICFLSMVLDTTHLAAIHGAYWERSLIQSIFHVISHKCVDIWLTIQPLIHWSDEGSIIYQYYDAFQGCGDS